MNLRGFSSAAKRRSAVEEISAVQLKNVGIFSFDEQTASSKHCENLIGATQIPLGVAGPLLITGEQANGDYIIPMATTEGALVASVSRGCKAITESGGSLVYAVSAGQTRGPVFEVKSLAERKKLYSWIKKNEEKIKEAAESTSSHLQVTKIMVRAVAHYLFVRFSFSTGDAMGMNMVTIATDAITKMIEAETGAKCLAVAGNFDIDKKPAWLNVINNRGMVVWAECVIPGETVAEVLKTSAEKIFDVWVSKCMVGSAMSGSLGFNAQFANVIAAIFIATGQDPAHVVEGSTGITTVKALPGGDLYVSVYLPSLLVGTVGGGTGLATQKEALEILGVTGEGKTEALAEIVGSAVLAGEISLLASLSEGSLSTAHKTLGR